MAKRHIASRFNVFQMHFPEFKVPLLYKCLHIKLESIPAF